MDGSFDGSADTPVNASAFERKQQSATDESWEIRISKNVALPYDGGAWFLCCDFCSE